MLIIDGLAFKTLSGAMLVHLVDCP